LSKNWKKYNFPPTGYHLTQNILMQVKKNKVY
jgi:hypothetical protein